MEESENWFDSLNLKKTCSKYRVSIFHCQQFLFLIMGCAQILAILTTYKIAKIYQEPEIAALIVLAVSAMIFFIGQIIINSFERIAISSLAKSEFISIISHQLVYADKIRVKRVIEYLLDNAVKYSLNGGSIEIDIEHEGKNILWKITDQGAGIPQKDQKRIFDKFFRSKNVARYKTSGSGIGLFIAKSIISLSKGKMGFFSSENKGSIFWFTLPTAGKINS